MTPAEQHAAVLAALDRQATDTRYAEQVAPDGWWIEDDPVEWGEEGRRRLVAPDGTIADLGRAFHILGEYLVGQQPRIVLQQLAGRRRILERHAPTDEGGHLHDNGVSCSRCTDGMLDDPDEWPYEEYRDAAAGLGVLDDTEASVQ